MSIGSVLNTGLAGMQRSSREMQKSAQDIVEIGMGLNSNGSETVESFPASQKSQDSLGDLAEPLVNIKFEQLIFEASAKIVKTADETLGALIDLKS